MDSSIKDPQTNESFAEDWDSELDDSKINRTRSIPAQDNRLEFLSRLKKMILLDNDDDDDVTSRETIPRTNLAYLLTSLRQPSIITSNEILPLQSFKRICCTLSPSYHLVANFLPADPGRWLSNLPDLVRQEDQSELKERKISSLPTPVPIDFYHVEFFDTTSTNDDRLIRNLLLQIGVKQENLEFDISTMGCISTELVISCLVSCLHFERAVLTAQTFFNSIQRSNGESVLSYDTVFEVIYKLGRIATASDTKSKLRSIEVYKQICTHVLSVSGALSDLQCAQIIALSVNINVDLAIKDDHNILNISGTLEMDIAAVINCQSNFTAPADLLLTSLVTTLELLKYEISPLSGRRLIQIKEDETNHIESFIAQITPSSSSFLQKLISKEQHPQKRDSNANILRKMLRSSPVINIPFQDSIIEGRRGLNISIADTQRFAKISLARAAFVLSFLEVDIDKKISSLIGSIAIYSTCPLRPFLVADQQTTKKSQSLLASHTGYAALMRLALLFEEQRSNSVLAILSIETACRIICIRDDLLELYAAAAGGLNASIPQGLLIRHAHFSAKAFQLERKLCIGLVRCELYEKAIFYHERVLASCLRVGRMREALFVTDALCTLLIDAGDLFKAELYLRSVLRQETLHVAALARNLMFRDRIFDEDNVKTTLTAIDILQPQIDEELPSQERQETHSAFEKVLQCFAKKERYTRVYTSLSPVKGWVVWNENTSQMSQIRAQSSLLPNVNEYVRDNHSPHQRASSKTRTHTLRSFYAAGLPLALTPNSEFYQTSRVLLLSWLDTDSSDSWLIEPLINLLPSIPHGAEYDAHKTTSTKAEITTSRLTFADLLGLESKHQMVSLLLNREVFDVESQNRLKSSLSRNDAISSINAIWSIAQASFINGEYSDALVAINQALPFHPLIMSKLTQVRSDLCDDINKLSRALDSALCVCSNGPLVWVRSGVAADVLSSFGKTRSIESKSLFENYSIKVSPNKMALNLICLHIKVNLYVHRPVEALRSSDLILRAFVTLLPVSQSTLLEPIRKLRELRGRALANIAASPATARLSFNHQHRSTSVQSVPIVDRGHSSSSQQTPLVSFKTSFDLTKAAVSSFSAAFRLCTAPGMTLSGRRRSLDLTANRSTIQNEYLALKSALRVAETLLDRRYGRAETDGESETNSHHKDIEIPVLYAVRIAAQYNEPFCLLRAELAHGELRALQSGLNCMSVGRSRTWLPDSVENKNPDLNQAQCSRLEESALKSAKDASELVCRLFSNSQGLGKFINSRKVSLQLRNRITKIMTRLALLFLVLGASASDKNWFIFNLLVEAQCNEQSSYRLSPPRSLVSSKEEREEKEPMIICSDSEERAPTPLWFTDLSEKSALTAHRSILPMLSPPRLGSSSDSSSINSGDDSVREKTLDTFFKIKHTASIATSTTAESDDEEDDIHEWKSIALTETLLHPRVQMIKSEQNDDNRRDEQENDDTVGSSVDIILGQLSLMKTACSRLRTNEETIRSIGFHACHKIQSLIQKSSKSTKAKAILFKPGVSFSELFSSSSIDPSSEERLNGLVFIISLSHEINVLYAPGHKIAQVFRGPLSTSLIDRQFLATLIDVPVRTDPQAQALPSFFEHGNVAFSNFASSLRTAIGSSRIFFTVSPKFSLWPFESYLNMNKSSRVAVGDCIVTDFTRKYSRNQNITNSVILPTERETFEMDLLRRRSLLSSHLRDLDSTLRRQPYPTGTATCSSFVKNLFRATSNEIASQEGATIIARMCNRPTEEDITFSLEAMNNRPNLFVIPDDWSIRSKLTNAFFSRRNVIEESSVIQYLTTQEILTSHIEDSNRSKILLLSFADALLLGQSRTVPLFVSVILFVSNSAVNLTLRYLNEELLTKKSSHVIAQNVADKLRNQGILAIVQVSS